MGLLPVLSIFFFSGVRAWTGEIHGRVICDVCGDSLIGPEDHVVEGHLSLSLIVSVTISPYDRCLLAIRNWVFVFCG